MLSMIQVLRLLLSQFAHVSHTSFFVSKSTLVAEHITLLYLEKAPADNYGHSFLARMV